MRKARIAVLTRTFLFVFMISFASGQDSPSPKRIEVKSPSSNGNIASLQSYAFSFDSDATPVNANNVEDLKNVSVQVVTAGRPVLVAILPENTNKGSPEPFAIILSGPAANFWTITIIRDEKVRVASFAQWGIVVNALFYLEIPFSLNAIDVPDSGSHTYTIRMQRQGMTGKCEITGARLLAYEL
jgi:hypothetical protein